MKHAAVPWVLLSAVVLMWAASRSFGSPTPIVPVPDSSESDRAAAVTDSLARAYEDSVAVWRAREAEAVAARADAEARAQRAIRRAAATRDSLAATLDSVGVAMLERYDAERDSIDAAQDRIVDSFRTQLLTTTAERDALLAERSAWYEERTALRGENAGLRSAVESLQERLREAEPSLLERIGDAIEKGALVKVGFDAVRASL